MSVKNLEFLFNPRRIAVIGANENQDSLGYCIFRNLVGTGFKGSVYPVNPNMAAIQGVEAYKKITDIQRDIDLAILAVPPEDILAALNECGQKGVKGVIILSPDFSYRAENPQLLQTKIKESSLKYGLRVLGPNSIGFIRPGLKLNASLFPKMPPKGNIAVISQSVTFSDALLDRAVRKNVGFSCFVSVGSRVDIGFSDIIDFLGIDPETRAIILYLESIKRGRKFMTSVRAFACSKPIVVIKSGRFEASAKVALTHSGILAGEDRIYDAVFKRAGAIRVDEMIDLFYLAETLAKQRRPKGNRLAIITNSGGPAVIAVDTLLRMGGELAHLSQETLNNLRNHVPSKRKIQNPIDFLYDAPPEEYEIAVKSCLNDKEVDGVLVIHTPSFGTRPKETAEAVARAAETYIYKPLLTSWLGGDQVSAAREFLNDKGIPTFVTPEQAARSFIYMYRYGHNLKLLFEAPEAILKDFIPDYMKVLDIINRATGDRRLVLTLNEVKDILKAYGIPVIPTWNAKTEDEALQISEETGYPVVLKIDSPKIFHKVEKGGVILNIRDQFSVKEAYKHLKDVATACGDPQAQVLIQPMIIKLGYELVIGAKKDKSFGSVIIFGTGGALLEAIEDYSVGLPPLNQTLARYMMSETKIYRYLRSQHSFENTLRQLEEVMVRFSQLIIDFPQIKEIDINPFFVTDKEGFALDAGILLEEEIPDSTKSLKGTLCPPHLSICPYPVSYVKEIKLEDGTPVLIRPVRPEDEPLMIKFFNNFSEQTIIMRFYHQLSNFSHEQLVRYCQIDYDREFAFVCEIREGELRRIIGDIRLNKQPDLETAEMAVAVADQWQGKGVGRILCEYCIQVAREFGVKKLWMEILGINSRMLKLSEKLGFKITESDNDVVKVIKEL
ncbi:MAG: bifunctional acetate--CoA ligase family protein/GNAT family N-acetyltransferase [Nitrospirota bacterium]|nr:bifunctional acetate--CoA ligase family protein/GNAT family N-acetyltransferase [Nitrospirota bacterium]MDH5768092.1 bifunctional acetate--CoA ligase family protein/GNAT family N-acetyltransferase [Nitrospirota bacterium]